MDWRDYLWLQVSLSFHLLMSMCRVFSCVVGRGCLLWPVHSLGRTLLAFALLHSVLQGQIYLLLQVFFSLPVTLATLKVLSDFFFFFIIAPNCVYLVSQSYLTLCNPMDCGLRGSSVHGILQATILEWVAISSSRGSSQPRDWTRISCVFCVGGRILYHWATWEAQF